MFRANGEPNAMRHSLCAHFSGLSNCLELLRIRLRLYHFTPPRTLRILRICVGLIADISYHDAYLSILKLVSQGSQLLQFFGEGGA